MTGEKNRFKTSEHLWKFQDETLTTPAHQILKKLTYGKHYISFTRSEIKTEITSIDDLSILPIVKLYHFLNSNQSKLLEGD